MFSFILFILFSIDSPRQVFSTDLKSHLDDSNMYKVVDELVKKGAQQNKAEKKKSYFEQARLQADICLSKHPNTWQSYYAGAVAYGALQQISGNAGFRKKCAHQVKTWIDESLRLNPTHADSWCILGLWHFRVANTSGIQALYLGDIKKQASLQEGKKYLLKAISIAPNEIKFFPMLASICMALKQNKEAATYLHQALAMACTDPSDHFFLINKCHELLNQIKYP